MFTIHYNIVSTYFFWLICVLSFFVINSLTPNLEKQHVNWHLFVNLFSFCTTCNFWIIKISYVVWIFFCTKTKKNHIMFMYFQVKYKYILKFETFEEDLAMLRTITKVCIDYIYKNYIYIYIFFCFCFKTKSWGVVDADTFDSQLSSTIC